VFIFGLIVKEINRILELNMTVAVKDCRRFGKYGEPDLELQLLLFPWELIEWQFVESLLELAVLGKSN